MAIETFHYDNKIVRKFMLATVVFGIVGMCVGLIIALQLAFPGFLSTEFTSFGRIRPLHTNAIIFAFVGNAMFMGIYYAIQRLLKAGLYSKFLGNLHFWGWQFIIVCAAITLPMGYTTGKEYAELEWSIDILIALVWVIFAVNFVGTVMKRRERHLYVAIWFFIATIVAIALLHIVNSIAVPVSLLKSYPVYAGVQDALVQWWYGHNAVAFFLTTPFLGLMYYYMPKAAGRPVFSYKLSIVHFWSLVFIYIWAGPHHLLYSTLPDWAQSLGVVFSIMLIAPSWGGMVNGLLTLRGAWDKVRTDPVLKFMVVAVTAYGMATFEGPMLALKNVNAISHFTDWTIAHVHVGGLGWNGFLIFGILYWLVPRMWGTNLWSTKLANTHFWIGTLGIIFYAIPMYIAGVTQGLMWKDFNAEGGLANPNFLDTVNAIQPFYHIRAFGGALFLIGALIMTYNLMRTAFAGTFIPSEEASAPALEKETEHKASYWHRWIERRPMQLIVATLLLLLVGTLIELVPTLLIKSNIPTISSVKPYTALELEGRDIYIREGCYTCHSQLVRPFRSEVKRYGQYSKAGEFVYDHPFQWGSRRIGPDLAREGGKNPNSWHYQHMIDPEATSTGTLMPSYPHLYDYNVDLSMTPKKINAMRAVGVPYPPEYDGDWENELKTQANGIADDIRQSLEAKATGAGKNVDARKEIIALIAYLQRLGTDILKEPKTDSLTTN